MSTRETTSPETVGKTSVFFPAVDIEEGKDDIVVWADVPGVSETDVRINLDKKVLTIEAKVKPDNRPSHQLSHREYQQGDFRRVFTISDAIDENKISATLKDGVLRLVLPKSEPAKPRTIAVNPA
jgi:HSP20 family molecular chaperone IbpA